MGKEAIGKLPQLGEITLPVHLMGYDDRDNPKKHFHSGFAFWKAGDGMSTVSDDDGNKLGTIGGTIGGHVEMNRYFPHENSTRIVLYSSSSKRPKHQQIIIDYFGLNKNQGYINQYFKTKKEDWEIIEL